MPVKPLGSDWDARGCVLSAGYQFCEILGKCIRSWEEACEIPEFYRYPWQYNLWNERFKTVYRTDSDTNAREDQNWLMKVRLEYPKSMSYIPFIGHTYNFDDPSKSTCQ